MSNIDLASKHPLVQVQGRRGPEGDGMGSGASDSAAGRIHGRVRGAHRSRKRPRGITFLSGQLTLSELRGRSNSPGTPF